MAMADSGPERPRLGLIRSLFTLRGEKLPARLILAALAFGGLYLALAARIVHLQVKTDEPATASRMAGSSIMTARPQIVDRNGFVMATDVKTVSVYADPRKVIDKDEAAELLNAVFPELDGNELRDKLSRRNAFVWIKREITPRQQQDVHRLGIPGIGFLPENKRVYPAVQVGAHVIGAANIDNQGIAGIEKYIDGQGLNDLRGVGLGRNAADLKPVELALDVRVTHAVREELRAAVQKFRADAGAALVLDVDTGEIITHVSLPDFDPNSPAEALKPEHVNRLQVGRYEMGSTFKALTTAMALDSGKVKLTSVFDASQPLRYGRFRIGDYKGKNRPLSVPEIFIFSSNIGTARMALAVGVEGHKAFLKKMGQLDRPRTELAEGLDPLVPARWGELNTMTISFGHGLAVAPLTAAIATAALVNGGRFIPATYLKRTPEEAAKLATQVIKPETSQMMRYVMRLNAEKGSASRADIPGYYVGGKTGTSEKVVRGRYSKNKVLTTFMAVMPSDKPRYLVMTMLDEPKGLPETHGYATSGWNAAPTTGRIIERIGPMLDIEPRFELPQSPFPHVARLGVAQVR
ncbi:MAG: penicillin-binding protein 2 [Methylobacterium sp.]|nr:penicillin-binding protein 2 [Methylobacterium sp.]MCA3596882.1 penicillin-binding protein 2 [Methylobacterium sp.]MCA3602154.1 penicillin-binding protein 2 [Methylobacterium sp.]MCA3606827.1 penicillin-binding protein 2 [Methylobacterium sp.]MCA3608496.1 penicillin-binding protein 2 [Methylobacterium sp.]